MTDKRPPSKTSKLKSFLVTGFVEEKNSKDEWAEMPPDGYEQEMPQEPEKQPEEEVVIEDIIVEEMVFSEPECLETSSESEPVPAAANVDLEREVIALRETVANLTTELGKCTTSKEQLKEYSLILERRDAELANRKFMGMLEQLSAMREDYFKLCKGIEAKLDSFSPKDIMGSFEAYEVDMENILIDCGVQIGPSKFDKLNTTHQRIVGIIPTGDEALNGMIAERMSDGYVYQGRVLQKEKVKIYKFSENGKTEGDEVR